MTAPGFHPITNWIRSCWPSLCHGGLKEVHVHCRVIVVCSTPVARSFLSFRLTHSESLGNKSWALHFFTHFTGRGRQRELRRYWNFVHVLRRLSEVKYQISQQWDEYAKVLNTHPDSPTRARQTLRKTGSLSKLLTIHTMCQREKWQETTVNMKQCFGNQEKVMWSQTCLPLLHYLAKIQMGFHCITSMHLVVTPQSFTTLAWDSVRNRPKRKFSKQQQPQNADIETQLPPRRKRMCSSIW